MFSLLTRKKPINLQILVLMLLAVAILASLIFFHQVMLPFALAIFLAYLLDPVIDHMNRLRFRDHVMPRGMAIILVYLFILGLLVLGGYAILPRMTVEITRMLRTLPTILREVEEKVVMPVEG